MLVRVIWLSDCAMSFDFEERSITRSMLVRCSQSERFQLFKRVFFSTGTSLLVTGTHGFLEQYPYTIVYLNNKPPNRTRHESTRKNHDLCFRKGYPSPGWKLLEGSPGRPVISVCHLSQALQNQDISEFVGTYEAREKERCH